MTVTPVSIIAGVGSQPVKPVSVPVIMAMVPITMGIVRCGSIVSSHVRTVISVSCWCS